MPEQLSRFARQSGQPSANGHLDEETTAQAQQFLESMNAVNLDEVTTETLAVAIREYKDIPLVDDEGQPLLKSDGTPRVRRKSFTRIAQIENFVPMRVFNKMLASRERVTKLRKEYLDKGGASGQEGDPIIGWMVDQVLAVWQLSEEDMERSRLEDGLSFQHIQKLFASFFGEILQRTTK